MSNCYKNFPVKIHYGDSTSHTIYGNSTSLSENLSLEHAESLGAKGSNLVFNKTGPKGDLNVDSYMIDDLEVYNNLKGSNDQEIAIDFGPYRCPSPCVMSSMSISIQVGEPITVQRTFNYFQGVIINEYPDPVSPELKPIIAENIRLEGFEFLEGAGEIKSIQWDFTQNYNEHYLLGSTIPLVSFGRGEISLNIDGEGLTKKLISNNCVSSANQYDIYVSGCDGKDLGRLSISGHMNSRSSNVSSTSDEENSVSIIQYL